MAFVFQSNIAIRGGPPFVRLLPDFGGQAGEKRHRYISNVAEHMKTEYCSFADLLVDLDPQNQNICTQLRNIIKTLDPNFIEIVWKKQREEEEKEFIQNVKDAINSIFLVTETLYKIDSDWSEYQFFDRKRWGNSEIQKYI